MPYDEIGLKYGVHESTVGKIKRKAGIHKKKDLSKERKIITPEQLERIKDVNVSARQLRIELGFSEFKINKKRKELGLEYIHIPKEKTKRVYVSRFKPKKESKPQTKKELPVKIMKPKKEVSPIKENQYEREQKQLQKAKLTADNHREKEALELKTTHKFITRIGRFGIRETVKVKREPHEIKTIN